MKVLILDLTHGGDVLARMLHSRGDGVTVCDIYSLASADLIDSLTREGIEVLNQAPAREFDLLIAPVHCPDRYIGGATCRKRMTFHQIVGELIGDTPLRIEVTGVKGKTSTCHLLADMISRTGKRVLLHTSRGRDMMVDGRRTLVEDKVSIAPTSLLTMPLDGVDAIVAEVSLGGSGEADLSLVTNLAEDYAIAAGTRKASEAKSSVLTARGINVVPLEELDLWGSFGHAVKTYGGQVSLVGRSPIGVAQPVALEMFSGKKVELNGAYVPQSLLGSIEAAISAAQHLGLPEEAILESLRQFRGVPGRGQVEKVGNGFLVKERNPGISHLSISHLLDALAPANPLKGSFAAIVPANRKVCEKLEMEKVEASFLAHGIEYRLYDQDDIVPVSRLVADHGTVFLFQKEAYQ